MEKYEAGNCNTCGCYYEAGDLYHDAYGNLQCELCYCQLPRDNQIVTMLKVPVIEDGRISFMRNVRIVNGGYMMFKQDNAMLRADNENLRAHNARLRDALQYINDRLIAIENKQSGSDLDKTK